MGRAAFARASVMLAVGVLAGMPCPAARADTYPILILWSAPEGCPDSDAVRRSVDHLLGGPPRADRASLSVDGRIDKEGQGYSLTLQILGTEVSGSRQLEASSCQTLAETGALLIAMAFDPDAVSANASHPNDGSAALDAPAAPKPPLPPNEPSPPSPPSNPPFIAPTTRPSAPPLQPAPSISPSIGARPWSARATPGSRPSFGVTAGFVGDVGALVGFSPGLRAGLGLGIGAYRIETVLELWPRSRSTLSGAPSRGATLSLVAGELRGCRRFVPWSESESRATLGGCLGMELGRIAGSGFGVSQPTTAGAFWIAPTTAIEGRLRVIGPVGVLLDVGLAVPLDRKTFVLQTPGRDVVHEPAPAVGRFSIGVDARF